jgi:FkbM family methyltransferase
MSLKKSLVVSQEVCKQKVTINGTTIYWPLHADVNRLVDMYFEVYEDNNHRFDGDGTEISKGDIVIDAGCCEGYFALKALKKGAQKVFCFEPGREMSNCLTLTFAEAIQADRIEIVNQLLGSINTDFIFDENPSDPTIGHILTEGTISCNNCYPISMTTIDAFTEQRQLQRVDFIKADVEGAELELLRGAAKTIARFSPKISIAVYHHPSHAKGLREVIKSIEPSYKFNLKGLADMGESVRPVMLHCFK